MELFIFSRFHVRSGNESGAEEALAHVLGPSRDEAGCLSIHAFRSIRDPRLFYIHSRWINEAAFPTFTQDWRIQCASSNAWRR